MSKEANEILCVESSQTQCGFVIIAVEKKGEEVHLTLTATAKGKLTKAKLGIMPLPLKLNVKNGTTLSFVLSES